MCQVLFCHKNNSCALYTHMLYYLGSEKSLDERKKFLYSWYIIMVIGCSIQAYVDNLFIFLLSHIAYLKVISVEVFLFGFAAYINGTMAQDKYWCKI